MATRPTTVDEYIEGFGDPARGLLQELRTLSRAAAPRAVEELKWGSPAYTLGTILFVFSGHKEHANIVFTPSTLQAFVDDLDGYTTGKGRVQLPYGVPIPTDVLASMIAYRLREFEEAGVGWR